MIARFRNTGSMATPESGSCNNHLNEVMLPIRLHERQLGYLFVGQFLLEDEAVETEYFREQAKKIRI